MAAPKCTRMLILGYYALMFVILIIGMIVAACIPLYLEAELGSDPQDKNFQFTRDGNGNLVEIDAAAYDDTITVKVTTTEATGTEEAETQTEEFNEEQSKTTIGAIKTYGNGGLTVEAQYDAQEAMAGHIKPETAQEVIDNAEAKQLEFEGKHFDAEKNADLGFEGWDTAENMVKGEYGKEHIANMKGEAPADSAAAGIDRQAKIDELTINNITKWLTANTESEFSAEAKLQLAELIKEAGSDQTLGEAFSMWKAEDKEGFEFSTKRLEDINDTLQLRKNVGYGMVGLGATGIAAGFIYGLFKAKGTDDTTGAGYHKDNNLYADNKVSNYSRYAIGKTGWRKQAAYWLLIAILIGCAFYLVGLSSGPLNQGGMGKVQLILSGVWGVCALGLLGGGCYCYNKQFLEFHERFTGRGNGTTTAPRAADSATVLTALAQYRRRRLVTLEKLIKLCKKSNDNTNNLGF